MVSFILNYMLKSGSISDSILLSSQSSMMRLSNSVILS